MSDLDLIRSDDPARTEAFGARLLEITNDGAVALMLSLGHRSGLFDALGRLDAPTTSIAIAEEAGLDERYVREWLGAMTTAGIVEYEPTAGLYHLPRAHAALLGSRAAEGDAAGSFQWFSVLARVEDDILDCFRNGGGVEYACFHRFHEVMADESRHTVVDALDGEVLALVPGLRERLEAGIDVVDLGCGSGLAMCALGARFPRSRFTGWDLCPEAIDAARAEADRQGRTNVEFAVRDVAEVTEKACFDLVCAFDIVHDQKEPDRVLRVMHDLLRPGGRLLMQDIRASSRLEKNLDHPLGPFLYTISTMHCMTVSLARGGAGLGTVWGEERALEMLDEAGFRDVEVRTLTHDIQNNWYLGTRAAVPAVISA